MSERVRAREREREGEGERERRREGRIRETENFKKLKQRDAFSRTCLLKDYLNKLFFLHYYNASLSL